MSAAKRVPLKKKRFTLGRFRSPAYQKWRLAVLHRDGFACKHCGKRSTDKEGRGLHCHHIYSWKQYRNLRYVPGNGIALCAECHKKEHARLRREARKGTKPCDSTKSITSTRK